jgi:hypothetical protein
MRFGGRVRWLAMGLGLGHRNSPGWRKKMCGMADLWPVEIEVSWREMNLTIKTGHNKSVTLELKVMWSTLR